MVKQLELENRVYFVGEVDKVVNEIATADIFIMTSNHEGMPNALIEAMAIYRRYQYQECSYPSVSN